MGQIFAPNDKSEEPGIGVTSLSTAGLVFISQPDESRI